jgi:hypothetical protein
MLLAASACMNVGRPPGPVQAAEVTFSFTSPYADALRSVTDLGLRLRLS